MRKKTLTVVLLLTLNVGSGWAASSRNWTIDSDIGPATSASNVTLATAGSGKKNCLTDLTVISASTYTFRILDGNTTNYAVLMGAGAGLIKEWSLDTAFCGTANTAMRLTVDNGTFNINYQGYVGR